MELPANKRSIKKALTEMSYGKCAYCECKLDIESKDVTIDHFSPKVSNDSLVVEWNNLLPACLRCNRKKNRKEDPIINPCEENPKAYIGVKKSSFRLTAINSSVIGKNTISVVGLNDIERVIQPRMRVIEKIIENLEGLYEDINNLTEIPRKYIDRCENYLSQALKDREYAAMAAAKVLDDPLFNKIKKIFIDKGVWNIQLQNIEEELSEIALEVV